MAKTKTSLDNHPRFRDVRAGDHVRLGGMTFRVTEASRENKVVRLDLQGSDGEISTLIGLSKAPLTAAYAPSEEAEAAGEAGGEPDEARGEPEL